MPNKPGSRMKCETCGAEIVITKGGNGSVTCCSNPMVAK